MVMSVVSHAGLRPLWFNYFYVYGFYFIGGYTFSDRPLKTFLKKKIVRLYIPYLVAQLIAIPVYYFEKVVSGEYAAISDVGQYINDAIMFDAAGGITAPSWYLFPMTLVLLLYFFLNRIAAPSRIAAAALVAYLSFSRFHTRFEILVWNGCAWAVNTVIGLLLFSLGHLLKEDERLRERLLSGRYATDFFAIDCVVMFIIFNRGCGFDIRAGYIESYIANSAVLIFGIHFLLFLSNLLSNSKWVCKGLSLAGRYSLQIMLYHVMVFFIPTMILHVVCGLAWPQVWSRNYTDGVGTLLNIAFGLTLPIAGAIAMERIKRLISSVELHTS